MRGVRTLGTCVTRGAGLVTLLGIVEFSELWEVTCHSSMAIGKSIERRMMARRLQKSRSSLERQNWRMVRGKFPNIRELDERLNEIKWTFRPIISFIFLAFRKTKAYSA